MDRKAPADSAVKQQPGHVGSIEGGAQTLKEAERLGRKGTVGHPALAVGAPRNEIRRHPVGLRSHRARRTHYPLRGTEEDGDACLG